MTARVTSILDEAHGWLDPDVRTVRELAPWLPRRRWFAPWLVFAAYAVWVPLLLATLAVLAGCVPEDGGTGPVRQVLPEVSTDSPRSWIVPEGGGR